MTTVLDHPNRVHEFLLSPSAFPETSSTVELRETHISWVYLTDRYAYKQKKPVSFEFLDFSTLDRRKRFCEQEVMLNRRLAPEVYLDVVPVACDTAGNYGLKQGANIVEWLVRMTRLNETDTLQNLIHNGRLSAEHVTQLCKRLTNFYSAQAPAMVRSTEFLQRLKHHILANRNDLLISLTGADDLIQFATNSQLRCLSLEADYFVQRVADGRVVDGHGDLRPEHVYFLRSKPLVIDCIEFNSEYRTNDVVDELAFLSIECDRLGNSEVGNSLLSTYFRDGGDQPREFLTEFYKSYRACVRAKVASLRATQSAKDARATASQKGRSYIELARQYAEKLGGRVVIMVGGLSGTGKSTLATALQASLAAELLQTDVIRQDLYAEGSENGKYTRAGRKRVYDVMIKRMKDAFSRSPTLILDGTFSTAECRRAVCEEARKLSAPVLQVQCECPPHDAMERITNRLAEGRSKSEASPSVYSAQQHDYEPVTNAEPLQTVDTTKGLSNNKEQVLAGIRELIRI